MKELYKKIKEQLKNFIPKLNKKSIKITVPVIQNINGVFIELKIVPNEDSYIIYGFKDLFSEITEHAEFYFEVFEKYDSNYHYDMKFKKNYIYKEFSKEHNIVVAVDQFIRYYILLENFIYNVIGHEADFPLEK